MPNVLVAGHVNWDVTLRIDRLPAPDAEASIRSRRQSGGGSAANVAVALARQGVDVSLIGSVGDDEHGARLASELEATDVDCAGVRTVEGTPTACKYLLVDDDGEVAVLGNDGANEAVRPSDVDPAVVRRADHVHLTSQRPETAAAIARIARDAGIPVSFDPGRRLGDRPFDATIERADVVFATGREAEALLGSEAGHLAFGERVVVVTAGADGAAVHAPDATYHHPGFDVESVDASGAGDAFAAGFVATTCETDDLERALRYANACGALTVRRDGARTAPSRTAVERFLAARE
ncbi:carbohydrate kinase family protein [Halovivax sp.]|uniref:carbohydrate kinase family protein n=1 Tax=Halovivax sp. TaxID=1935978 RepID=UPI0025C56F9E|nr:carbohydrate kinase family protein [Halovivax sp.]